MDVDQLAFPQECLKILAEVADSHFVAFDLEFSGVASRRPMGTGKLSLQEYYDDIRVAAEKYQILQVGLTVVKQDQDRNRYVARPYNFTISPLTSLRERHFGREWSYHSGAISFLTRHGFEFDRPITYGVQYLSRHEERLARQNMVQEEEARSKIADMELKPEDDALIQHIRSTIRKWQSQPKKKQEEYVNIPTEQPGVPTELNRYQVRLTHQIVRSEYPNLKTVGMGHFVQVTNPTAEQQASQKLAMVEGREKDIAKAVGFRWLVEGLVGGNILNMPGDYLLGTTPNRPGITSKDLLQDLQLRLRNRPRVLVGHNCFTDFANFYKCFIGPLPRTVGQFASEIHELFPGVVDTKLLASAGTRRGGHTSLEDVELSLRSQEKPKITVPAEYDRYVGISKYHEAGYDSLLTAKVAIRLSARLDKEQDYPSDQASENDFGVNPDVFHDSKEATTGLMQSLMSFFTGSGPVSTSVIPSSKATAQASDSVDADSDQAMSNPLAADKVDFDVGGSPGNAPAQSRGQLMPAWGDKRFWGVFGNKLQVNGSKEGVCKIE